MNTKEETNSLATEIISDLIRDLKETRNRLALIRSKVHEEIERLDKILNFVEK